MAHHLPQPTDVAGRRVPRGTTVSIGTVVTVGAVVGREVVGSNGGSAELGGPDAGGSARLVTPCLRPLEVASPAIVDIAQLVMEHHAHLYRHAYRLCGRVADAEDLTQQTFLIANQKLSQLRQADSARGWLIAVLRNCFLKQFRKRAPAKATDLGLEIDAIAVETLDQPIDREALDRALNQLANDQRVILVLFYFEQQSYRQIAKTLDLPPGTVMSRLARAKQRLRRLLFDPEV